MKQYLLAAVCSLSVACGSAPFTQGDPSPAAEGVEPSSDDAGSPSSHSDTGVSETTDAGMSDPPDTGHVVTPHEAGAVVEEDAGSPVMMTPDSGGAVPIVVPDASTGPMSPTLTLGTCTATSCPAYYTCTPVALEYYYCDP